VKRLIVLFIILASAGDSQADITGLFPVEHILELPMAQRQAAAEQLISAEPSNPVRFDNTDIMMLLYMGPGRDLRVAGDFTDWQPHVEMIHIQGTRLWYYATEFPSDARLDYKIIRDGEWILDPNNPATCMSGFGPNSEMRGRDYHQPPQLGLMRPESRCRLDTLHVRSPQLGGSREVVVISPSGPDSPDRPYLLVHDGLEYMSLAGLEHAWNWMTSQLPTVPICICVPPVRRTEEYATDLLDDFGRFIVDTLIPEIEIRYGERGLWGTMGASYGGNISLYLARRYPEHFDRVAAMSPSVAPAQHNGIAVLDPTSLKLYVNWGIYDIQRLIPDCERFVGMLEDRGFEHMVEIKPQGHSWGFWRDSLIPAFRYLYTP
jgi:enterochelin esterase-like enzyme